MPCAGSAPLDAAQGTQEGRRRGGADNLDHRSGAAIWTLWLSSDHDFAARRRLADHKRVERIWRSEGLKVPQWHSERGRLWLNDSSCVRLRPQRPNDVWAYDFVEDRTRDGRKFRTLNVVDEFTREALAIRVARRLKASDVIDVLADLFLTRGSPSHIRSDNGRSLRRRP